MAKKKNQVKKLPTTGKVENTPKVENQATQNPVNEGATEGGKVENQEKTNTITDSTKTPKTQTTTKKKEKEVKVMTVNQVKKLPTEEIREIEKLCEKGELKVIN